MRDFFVNGGEAADWVEIMNPTSGTISTAGYYFSPNSSQVLASGDAKQFALPLRNMAPGEYLIIYCTKEGKARLGSSNPLAPQGFRVHSCKSLISY